MKQPRLLEANEISCRVQSVTKNNGAIILLYKDARVDMNILDDTFGAMNWQREHLEVGGNLHCIIRVWDDDKKQWVAKQDVGTESFTEATKGEASDSFKRAGFNWGIGRELYTGPFIFVQLKDDEWEVNDRGKKSTTFRFGLSVKEIGYNDNREINRLVLIDKQGVTRYTLGQKTAEPVIEKEQPKQPAIVTRVDVVQRNNELKALLSDYNKTIDDYKAVAGERTVVSLTEDEYTNLLAELQKAWA